MIAVAQEIDVQLPIDQRRSDQDIAGAVVERLRWNGSIPNGAVKVMVSKGVVTLTGELDWNYQKDVAETEVRNLRGVVDVVDRVVLKGRVNTADVSEAINTALKRSWYTRPDSIVVKADEGKVTLSGVVHSPHARAIAWNAPGATDVVNRLTVS